MSARKGPRCARPAGRFPAGIQQNRPYRQDRPGMTSPSGRATSSHAADPSDAWNVDFDDADVDNDDKDDDNDVRCVRPGTWLPGRPAGQGAGP